MPAFEPSVARSALPLYLLSLGGLAACTGTSLWMILSDGTASTALAVALAVAAASLLANAVSIRAMLRTCAAAARSLRRSAGIDGTEARGDPLARLVRAVQDVDAAFLERQREIERLNYADPLTGLGNRRWLQIVASRAFSQAEMLDAHLSTLMLRVDRLQEINTTYGHDAGDRALLGCADLLRRLVRRSDSVARVSGNEFVVLLPGADAASAEVVALRLRECLASFPQSLLGDAPLSTRLTVAEWKGEKMLETLLARAQEGLDALPVADVPSTGTGALPGEEVARQDLALVGVRPADAAPARLKRRRQTDR